MACEYCEGDRNMLAVTSTYTGMTADETLIESLCILPASPNEKPIRKHVIVTYMADGSRSTPNRSPTVRSAGESCR